MLALVLFFSILFNFNKMKNDKTEKLKIVVYFHTPTCHYFPILFSCKFSRILPRHMHKLLSF